MAKAKNKDVNEIQVFEDFTDEEVMTISKYSEKKFYQRDEIVFEEKTKDASLYVVLKGRLQAFAHTDEGEKIPLSYIEQGEVFGELSFLDGKQRSATILAVADVELLQLTRKKFEDLTKKFPVISSKLIMDLARVVSLRLRNADKFIVEIFQLINKDKQSSKAPKKEDKKATPKAKEAPKKAPKALAKAEPKVKEAPKKAPKKVAKPTKEVVNTKTGKVVKVVTSTKAKTKATKK